MGLGDLLLVLLRTLHLLAMMSLFGTLLCGWLVLPASRPEAGNAFMAAGRSLRVLARTSAVVALAMLVAWVVAQNAAIAGAATPSAVLRAQSRVLAQTQFGHLAMLRMGLLVVAVAFVCLRWPRPRLALAAAAAALALQGGMSHAGAAGGASGVTLLMTEAAHLLAAGAWIGGLLPLLLCVLILPPNGGRATARAFSPLGLSALLLITGTAVIQAGAWVNDFPGLLGTPYGWLTLVKLGLLALLIGLAATNRFLLTERLVGAFARRTRMLLLASIGIEASLGALTVLVAASLASTTPATHTQPIWPLSVRLSLDGLADPTGRGRFASDLVPIGLSTVALLLGWIWRPARTPSLLAFAAILPLCLWQIVTLLAVPAYPTTFVSSPTEFAASSIVRGAALFQENCATCHGVQGRGDGSAAVSLPLRPADLTAPHLLAHSDGDLYWFITHGINAPSGVAAMPAFGAALSSGARWALVDFLRAHNTGFAMRNVERWKDPVPLPQFDAICADGSAIERDDLRGRAVRIAAVDQAHPPPALVSDVLTVVLPRERGTKLPAQGCVAAESVTWLAFAILLGTSADTLAGTQVLADPNLALRVVWRPGASPPWSDATLATLVRDIIAHPLPATSGASHASHH